MIRRVSDYSALSDKDLNKLASIVKEQDNKQLHDSVEDQNLAHTIAAELRVKGFKTEVTKIGKIYNVYKIVPESIPLHEAENSGNFKKIAWGHYSFQKNSSLEMNSEKYNFNDGSIWVLSSDENGNQVLIKKVEDDDEENVIRNVNNDSNVRFASNDENSLLKYANDKSVNAISKILYKEELNSNFLKDILVSEAKSLIFNMLDSKLDNMISAKIANFGINDKEIANEIKSLVAIALGDNINSVEGLHHFVSACVKDHFNKIGSQRNYFK